MKRLTIRAQLRQMRLSQWAMETARASNRRPHATRRASGSPLISCEPPARLRFHAPRIDLEAFERFADRVETLLTRKARVSIDFRNIVRLYPCGVLLLMGLVDDWVQRFPGQLSARYPKDDLAEQMLQHVEILQKLGLQPRKQVDHVDVKRWHYLTGSDVRTEPFNDFMLELRERAGEETQLGLGDCLAEAMTNVRQHAYANVTDSRWWAFCTVSDKKVFVAMHDRGETIPGTLIAKPTMGDFVRLRRFRAARADGELITAAAGGRTRTKLPHRGKGLQEMLAYTKQMAKSELGIYSRHGFFRYLSEPVLEHCGRLRRRVPGTLVLWMVNLAGDES